VAGHSVWFFGSCFEKQKEDSALVVAACVDIINEVVRLAELGAHQEQKVRPHDRHWCDSMNELDEMY
jgi:hypothetical protein